LETLFSLLGLYQLSALLLPGAVGVAGAYYAVGGVPPDPSTAAVLGLIVVFYFAGNVIQGGAVLWEARYWRTSGGWPSTRRMTPEDAKAYDPAFRALVQSKLNVLVATDTAGLPVSERFALARAELRRQTQDARAEAFNAIYGLSRGLVTAAAVAVIVLLASAAVGHAAQRDLIAAAVLGGSILPLLIRFHRFGFYFADQVWRDFAALGPVAADS
jgi:hypothetical protein